MDEPSMVVVHVRLMASHGDVLAVVLMARQTLLDEKPASDL